MEQKTISESVRFVSAFLAVVVLATLGLMTLRVHAEEANEQNDLVREENSNRENQRTGEEKEAQNIQNEKQEAVQIQEKQDMSTVYFDKANILKEDLQLRKIDREKIVGGYKATFSLQKQARLGQFVERITVRMNTATDRLEQIADRVMKRIETLEREKDIDLFEARSELEKVYIAIYDAREFVTLFGAISTDAFSSENPVAQAQEIRDTAKLAKEAMLFVHTTLSSTVQLIKASDVAMETNEEVVQDVEVTE